MLTREDLTYVNDAVLAQCDTLDGVADGVIEDPRRCDFDPGVLQCGLNSQSQCLAPDQVRALRQIYRGPINPETGERIHRSLAPGGEPTWSLVSSSGAPQIPLEYFGRSVIGNSNWDWRSFDFAADAALAHEKTGLVLNAVDPDLSAFRDGGSKLLLYHGWNDQVIPPEGSIDYYEAVETTLASRPNLSGRDTDDFFRLFMVPGMTHCRGGPGTSQFDAQSAIEAWVERGIAPDRIEAQHLEGNTITRTRPLCPYPQTAQYRGSGNTDRTGSFVCSD
jgi:feruloyl esterase